MQTYERYKRGHNYTITKKGKEETDTKSCKMPLSIIGYLKFYARCKNVSESSVIVNALIALFQENDAKLIKEFGFKDYELDPYKSEEYIQLYESTLNDKR
jgi:hypothetical protein